MPPCPAPSDRTTVIYLPDLDVLPDLQPGWPPRVGAAYGLSADGSAAFVFFHADEPDPLPWISRHLRVPLDDFLVVPRRDGHGTRDLSFADEQALLAAIEAEHGLVDAARAWREATRVARPPAPAPARRAPRLTGIVRTG
ncbi:hypothetical protein JQC91_05180 [Jannaschia sp. Os4]|uniref:hypothetical protein n=1 Tax=Jannaschia sp. Os4 TaxID=2807617 RepID=UPI00193995D3|nr:hypothetical protein [Jannaschia sp. Os4]MBM2575692.1 hypothetical protein [Jannaschia sp. Os4]